MTTEPRRSRQPRSQHRAESQWQSTFRSSDGRWIMHREMRTDDGGVIGISTDITALKIRQDEAEQANETAKLLVSDLERTLDSLRMGVVLLDASLTIQVVNKEFYDIWKIGPADVSVGSTFRTLMDVNRHKGIYDVADEHWETYVASRLDEIRAGDVAPREFARADGCTMVYSVTALSGGKRLVCYYDITDMKRREAELADAKDQTAELLSNLRSMVDSMSIGIIVLDADLKTEIINRAFYDFWAIRPDDAPEGSPFRHLMDVSRGADAHGASDAEWEAHVAERQAEIRSGTCSLARAVAGRWPHHDLHDGAAGGRQAARLLSRRHRDEAARGRAGRRAGALEARRGGDRRRQGSRLRQGQRAEFRHRQPRLLRHVRPRARGDGRQERPRFLFAGGGCTLRHGRAAGAVDRRSPRIRGGSGILRRRADQDRAQEPGAHGERQGLRFLLPVRRHRDKAA